MMLLVINKPIAELLDSGLMQEVLENVSEVIQEVAEVLPTGERLVARWMEDEAGKLFCRWIKEPYE